MSKKVTNELNDLQARIHDFHQALDSLSFSSSSKKPKQNNKDYFDNKSPPKSAKKREREADSIYSRDSHRIEGSMRTAELLSDREIEYYKQHNRKTYSVSSRANKSNATPSEYRSPIITNRYSAKYSTPFSYVNKIGANTPSAQSNYQYQNRYMFSRRQEASPYIFQRANSSVNDNYSPVSTRYIPSPQFQLTRSSQRPSNLKMPSIVLSSSTSSSEEDEDLPTPVYPDSDDDLDLKKVPTLEELTGESELYYSRASSQRGSRYQYDSYSEASSVHNYKPIPPKRIKQVEQVYRERQMIQKPIPFEEEEQEQETQHEYIEEEEEEEEEERYEPNNNQYPDTNSTATMDQHEMKMKGSPNMELSRPLSFSCQSSKNEASEVELAQSEYTYASEEEYNEQSYLDQQSYYSYYTTGQSQVEREQIPIQQYHEQTTQTNEQAQITANRSIEKANNSSHNTEASIKQQNQNSQTEVHQQSSAKQSADQKEEFISEASLNLTDDQIKPVLSSSSAKSNNEKQAKASPKTPESSESLTEIKLPNNEETKTNSSKETQTDPSELNNSKDSNLQNASDEGQNQSEKPKRINGEYISNLFRNLPLIISSSDDDDDELIIFRPPIPDKVVLGDPLATKEFKPVVENKDNIIPDRWNTVGETPPEMFKNQEEEEEEEEDQDTNLITQDTLVLTPGATSSDGWGVPMGSSPSQSQGNIISDSEPISYVTTKQEPFVSVTDTDLTKTDDLASLPNSETTKKTSQEPPPLVVSDLQTSTYEEGASSSYFLDGDDLQ